MGRAVTILVVVLLCSFSAAAQGPVGVGSSGTATSKPWQVAVGYQYNAINLTGQGFQTNGANFSLARYFAPWFGLEAQLGTGFGNTGSTTTPPNLTAKSLSLVGGPRLAIRGRSRIEPWIHGDAGLLYFRFNQTAGVLGSNTSLAFQEGGGLDLLLSRSIAARAEADFMETRFFSLNQRHFQVIGGIVFNF